MAAQYQFVMRAGPTIGKVFPLEGPEITIGRESTNAIAINDVEVSRKHARMEMRGPAYVIQDLGSTNGTFVNGEKIKKATLKEGDRVLIGTSILKVVSTDPGAPMPRRQDLQSAAQRGQTRSMTGAIDEIPLPDLLQLLGSSKKSGVLVVRSDDDVGKTIAVDVSGGSHRAAVVGVCPV